MSTDQGSILSSSREIRELTKEISAARATLAAAAGAPGPMELLSLLTQALERLAATQHELVNVLLDRGENWDTIGRALDTSGYAAERRFPRRERRAT